MRCYLLSIFMITISLSVVGLSFWNGATAIAVILITIGTIVLLAPIEDSNKPLDNIEKTTFKKQTNTILSILTIIVIIFWFFRERVSICIIVSMSALAIMLILGKIKNILGKRLY